MDINRSVHVGREAAVPELTPPMNVPDGAGEDGKLEVFVLFTNTSATLAALNLAERLARKLGVRLRLLMPYEVPYTLPLARPAVPVGFLEGQLHALASTSPLDISAQIFLCRDKRRTLRLLLKPHSLLVIGGRKRWWPTEEQRLAKMLKQDGHQVIFAELR